LARIVSPISKLMRSSPISSGPDHLLFSQHDIVTGDLHGPHARGTVLVDDAPADPIGQPDPRTHLLRRERTLASRRRSAPSRSHQSLWRRSPLTDGLFPRQDGKLSRRNVLQRTQKTPMGVLQALTITTSFSSICCFLSVKVPVDGMCSLHG